MSAEIKEGEKIKPQNEFEVDVSNLPKFRPSLATYEPTEVEDDEPVRIQKAEIHYRGKKKPRTISLED